jgi:hypothetical protein
LKRQVKGRKGVGKFAGLMAAAHMRLETRKDGLETSFEFNLTQLEAAQDIEKLDIELKILPCASLSYKEQRLHNRTPRRLRIPKSSCPQAVADSGIRP